MKNPLNDMGLQKFSEFYRDFSSQPLEFLSQIYHSDVVFTDPVGEWRGLLALRGYFEHSRRGLTQCTFQLKPPVSQDTKVFVEWRMDYAHKKLAGGRLLQLDGASVLTLVAPPAADLTHPALIIAQRDYYDLSAMVLENAPLVGHVARFIKRQLRNF